MGLTIDTLGRVLRNRLNGVEAASFPDGPRSATIRVELPAGELTADFTDRMLIRTPDGGYVPLADIVTVQQRTGFSTVRRENGIQVISVTGDISEDDPARAQAIVAELEETILPKIAEETQVAFTLAGLAEQEDDFRNDATRGLVLTLGLESSECFFFHVAHFAFDVFDKRVGLSYICHDVISYAALTLMDKVSPCSILRASD